MLSSSPNSSRHLGRLRQAAREISKSLGHQEIITPLHLLLALLLKSPLENCEFPTLHEATVFARIATLAPPWSEMTVLSPGGSTPGAKRIFDAAAGLSVDQETTCDDVWHALMSDPTQRELLDHVSSLLDVSFKATDADDAGVT